MERYEEEKKQRAQLQTALNNQTQTSDKLSQELADRDQQIKGLQLQLTSAEQARANADGQLQIKSNEATDLQIRLQK